MGRKFYDAYRPRRFLNLDLNEKRDEAVTTSYGSSFHTKGQFTKKEYLKTLIHDWRPNKVRLLDLVQDEYLLKGMQSSLWISLYTWYLQAVTQVHYIP